jgi:hypothetical protein
MISPGSSQTRGSRDKTVFVPCGPISQETKMFMIHQTLAEAIHRDRQAALTRAEGMHRVHLRAQRRAGREALGRRPGGGINPAGSGP